jgi:hypothetical protein
LNPLENSAFPRRRGAAGPDFRLYGVENEDDVRYILSTFPTVERKDRAAFDGVYLAAELIIWRFRALAAGDPHSQAPETALIRAARRA